ncbi:NAD(P)/FAD-dependent oxidoreductase [Streptomyces sp. NPDC087294]|uniref:NAD(P)/FAD-dependent oxidoreductase n=1 Tax=Streptomyces sp. NPDC087294 TaxID=3365777 RepID=UPI0037F92DD2
MTRVASSPPHADRYDVALIGSGLAGGILGTVLARNGVRVLLLDATTHPRFAVGESTIPYTSAMAEVIAERYGVPEVGALASFAGVRSRISPMCGQKRNFGFVHHEVGRAPRHDRVNQEVIPEYQGTETHLFRQDVDAYFFHLAVRCGAEPRLNTRITGIETDADRGVVCRSDRGEEFRAAYVVDSSGFRSPVAQAFGLRDEPTRARAHSRSLFTHMIGVEPFDDMAAARACDPLVPWHQGTLHHVFDGGWLWVIPFDNYKGAPNPLCSVGLTLDERVFPPGTLSGQQEFDAFLRRFPRIAEQFRTAKAVRPWVSTGRLQYSAHQTVGDRYCLTAHAAGFIDALYSRGMTNTLEVVNSLAWRLIRAVEEDDWSTERFAYVDRLQQGLFDVHDDLVYSSFVGFRDYALWNAVTRVWKATSILTTMTAQKALRDFRRDRDEGALLALESDHHPGLPGPFGADVSRLLVFTRELCAAVEAGALPAQEAAATLFTHLRNAEFLPPPLELGVPENRMSEATADVVARITEWGRTRAPEQVRALFV